ncbi:MAG: hypothetical protein PHF33_00365 [Candidatus Delongbacteria bacterium]|nr:hypothetical protein [Candidatus Delongbacteria bacterium]MDD4205050.1 hypothetical protein [Candidatus Delongbacteria bacterium]
MKKLFMFLIAAFITSVVFYGCSSNNDPVTGLEPEDYEVAIFADSNQTLISTFNFEVVVECENPAGSTSNHLFAWDFDGDGVYDTDWVNNTQAQWKYKSIGSFNATVSFSVGDSFIGSYSKEIIVEPIGVTVSLKNESTTLLDVFEFQAVVDDVEQGTVLQYKWDYDGDGTWDTGWLSETILYDDLGNLIVDTLSSNVSTFKFTEVKTYASHLIIRETRSSEFVQVGTLTHNVTLTDLTGVTASVASSNGRIIDTFEFVAGFTRSDMSQLPVYRWDFDGDGNWDTGWLDEDLSTKDIITSKSKLTTYKFNEVKTYNSKVQVGVKGSESIILGETTRVVTVSNINADVSVEYLNTGTSILDVFEFQAEVLDVSDEIELEYKWDFDGNGVYDTDWLKETVQTDDVGNIIETGTSINLVDHQFIDADSYVTTVFVRELRSDVNINLGTFGLPISVTGFMNIVSPSPNLEFNIGETITIEIEIIGDLTLFEKLEAYVTGESVPFYVSNTADVSKVFSLETTNFGAGSYDFTIILTTKYGTIQTKSLGFTLKEYIPTFTTALGTAGYELKSLIETYDGGYLAVSSGTAGTKVIKYEKEGAVQWSTDIPAATGIANSVCEDTEYDKGYVLAGWRNNGADQDTWIRKINQTDGSLIWNKTYGYPGVDDGATVIKKSVDDGYIIGGYTYNIWGTGLIDDMLFPGVTWETGYDVRMLKVYSNGNEIWGYNVGYVGQKMWQDISLHKENDFLWVKKMGDQMITDLIVKDDGNYLISGWNNWRLYNGVSQNDMFYAELNNFGEYVSTMTWSRMGSGDFGNMAGEDDPYGTVLNISLIGANHIGDLAEEEISYGFVLSQGGLGGEVVMAGETNQTDSKARLNDAWVVEFTISGDEDGALWEYTFGETGKNDKAYGIDRTKDGGYIVTGYSTGTDKNTWLFKLDSQMGTIWSKNLGVAGDDVGVKVLQAKDGGFIIGANVGTGASAQSKLMKVDKTGTQPVK